MKVFRTNLQLLIVVMILQFFVFATVIIDIPVARQVIGFLYLLFVPGYILVRLLGLNDLDELGIMLFSIGLSVAFLILAGLFMNEFLFLLGVSQPLSLIPLLLVVSGFTLLGTFFVCLRNKNLRSVKKDISAPPLYAFSFLCLPILSVIGAAWVNMYQSNLIVLLTTVLVSVFFSAIVICRRILPSSVYLIALFTMATALLYQASLISNYLVSFGSDVPAEYFIFRITQNGAHWSSTFPIIRDPGYGRLNAMLSINILPTIYSTFLNIDPTWLFKLLYPTIFAFVPLCLYRFWEPSLGKKNAFVATFLFMAQATFYTEMLGLNRQIIAELFFALLLIVVSAKNMKALSRVSCFIILSAGLIMSHYGLAEIFLLLIFIAVAYLIIRKKPSQKITIPLLLLFFVIMFSWYLYTSNAAVFDSFVSFGNHVYTQLNQFLNPESRGKEVLRGLGLETPPTIWNSFGRAFAYLTELLVAAGFVGLITKKVDDYFEREQYVLSLIAVTLLAMLVLVPGLANTLGMSRFYHILLFLLASLCVVGAGFIAKLAFKQDNRRKFVASILLVGILVPYFLFQSGFVYEITGNQSYSLPLGKNRMSSLFLRWRVGYFDDSEVISAIWLSKNVDPEVSHVYADAASAYGVLIGYGTVYNRYMEILSNVTFFYSDWIVYLNKPNVVDETVVSLDYVWNITDISVTLDFSNKIYSNGYCETYKTK